MKLMEIPARVAAGILLAVYCVAAASDPASDIKELRQAVEEMKAQYEKRIRTLEERLKAAEAAARRAESAAGKVETVRKHSALDAAVAEVEAEEKAETVTEVAPPSAALWSGRVGGADVRLLDIGVNLLGAAGTSSVDNNKIEQLQGGEHDPKRRGFTFQQAELSFMGAVDPYLTGEVHVVASEEGLELEEAFITTTSLPWDLQLEAGYFLTEFGLINPTHAHTWDWLEQPVMITRFFGPEGQRAAGFRLAKLLPTPWFSELHIGAQDPTREQMPSFQGEFEDPFEGESVGGFERARTNEVDSLGDLGWLARWVNAWDFSPETTAQLGLSFLYGSNSTGSDGDTYIYGTDLKVTWLPANNYRGWPFLTWQSEFAYRDYKVDEGNPNYDPAEHSDLQDVALYTQLLWGFRPHWETGLRFEYAKGSDDAPIPRDEDPLRDERYRVSPILAWRPTEFTRVRLQYNYDDADFLEGSDPAHSVWLGFDASIGAHPAHKY